MKSNKLGKYITTICFLEIMAMFFFGTLVLGNVIKNSNKERRVLAIRPPFSLQSFWDGDYIPSFDEYFRQNLFLRDWLLEMDSFIQKNILLKNNVNWVYFGEENQLLLSTETFSEVDKDIIGNNIEKINLLNDYLSEENIKLYMFSFPRNPSVNKGRISSNDFVNKMDFASDFVDTNIGESVVYVNLLPEVLDLNQERDIYFKTDHHWNYLGGYYAYNRIIETLKCDFPEIPETIPLEDIQFEVISDTYIGSYGRRYGFLNVREKDMIIKPIFPTENDIDFEVDGTHYDSMFFDSNLQANHPEMNNPYFDEYNYYAMGNYPLVIITNNSIDNDITLTVSKDSFMLVVLPYLINNVKTIYAIDPRYFEGDIYYYMDQSDAVIFANAVNLYMDEMMTSSLRESAE